MLRLTDDDNGTITVALTKDGKEAGISVRSWAYADDAERHARMKWAREFIEGWLQCKQRQNALATTLHPQLLDIPIASG